MPSRNGPPCIGIGAGRGIESLFSALPVFTKAGRPLFPILALLTRRLSSASSLMIDSSAIVLSIDAAFGLYTTGDKLPKLSGIAALDA